MSQQFNALKCCSCDVFQVHQVKKSLKWSCKLCGQKQFGKKVYCQGSGAECRMCVQQLNLMQGQNHLQKLQDATETTTLIPTKNKCKDEYSKDASIHDTQFANGKSNATPTSRWPAFLEKESWDSSDNKVICEDMHDVEALPLHQAKKKFRKRQTRYDADCLENNELISMQSKNTDGFHRSDDKGAKWTNRKAPQVQTPPSTISDVCFANPTSLFKANGDTQHSDELINLFPSTVTSNSMWFKYVSQK